MLGLQGAQAGRRCPPLPVSRRQAGLCPAARRWPRSCAERQESGAPQPLFLKSGSWEPAPGLLAAPVPRRCGRRDSSGAPSALSGGHLRGREAGAEGFPWSHPSRGGEDREGTPEPPALFARRREACTPVLLSSLLRTSPGSGSKIPKQGKKEKARGRGRCRLQRPPSPPVGRQQRCYWRRGAARGRLRGGPRLSAGSAADGPRASSGGGDCTAGGAGGGSPRGCTTCGKGWKLVS